jgi:hypothetical protein
VSIDAGDKTPIYCDGAGVHTITFGSLGLKDYIAASVTWRDGRAAGDDRPGQQDPDVPVRLLGAVCLDRERDGHLRGVGEPEGGHASSRTRGGHPRSGGLCRDDHA